MNTFIEMWIPQIHIWWDTRSHLDSQHGNRAFSDPHICTLTLVGLEPGVECAAQRALTV